MERERPFDHDRLRPSDGGPLNEGNLNQHREEVDGLLRAADRVFDAIHNPQQYLHQNLQTGGQ